jgi:hypothetical protein
MRYVGELTPSRRHDSRIRARHGPQTSRFVQHAQRLAVFEIAMEHILHCAQSLVQQGFGGKQEVSRRQHVR